MSEEFEKKMMVVLKFIWMVMITYLFTNNMNATKELKERVQSLEAAIAIEGKE